MTDFFERGLADQIGTDAVEHDGGPHAPFFERRAFRHPDEEAGDYFNRERTSFMLWIYWFGKKRIFVGFHIL